MRNSTGKVMSVAKRAARGLGLDHTKARPHKLLLFTQFDPNEGSYKFPVKHEDAKAIISLAKGLLDRDAFLAVRMAMGILSVPVIGGSEYPSAGELAFFPDPNIFDGPATNVLTEVQALSSYYWADITLQTNEGIRLDKMPAIGFRTVLQTQGSATTLPMQNGNEFKDLESVVRFGGGDENEIIVKIDSGDKSAIAGPADRNNYGLIILDGAIIKGSTTKQYLG